MSQAHLSTGKVNLLMLGVATIALMGVPGFGRYEAPRGAITGLVVDAAGGGVSGAEVALFEGHGLGLSEIVVTDQEGRFAFHGSMPYFHVYARDWADPSGIGAWVLGRELGDEGGVVLTLYRGAPVRVRVTDEVGRPLKAIEVRAYDARFTPTVMDRRLTDEGGSTTLTGPALLHLAFIDRTSRSAPLWLFDQEIPPEGRDYAIALGAGALVAGLVEDADGAPLEGILVTAGEPAGVEGWTGYALTAADGSFQLSASVGTSELLVCDPTGAHLSARLTVSESELPRVTLPAGERLEILSEARTGRVWVWSEQARTWSFGTPLDEEGRATARVSANHAIVIDSREPGVQPFEAWGLAYGEPTLSLVPAED